MNRQTCTRLDFNVCNYVIWNHLGLVWAGVKWRSIIYLQTRFCDFKDFCTYRLDLCSRLVLIAYRREFYRKGPCTLLLVLVATVQRLDRGYYG